LISFYAYSRPFTKITSFKIIKEQYCRKCNPSLTVAVRGAIELVPVKVAKNGIQIQIKRHAEKGELA